MGLLDRLRGWLGASGDRAAADDDADETDADETGVDDGPRLDPEKATEIRSREENDPVERLRTVEGTRKSEPEPELEPTPDDETGDDGA